MTTRTPGDVVGRRSYGTAWTAARPLNVRLEFLRINVKYRRSRNIRKRCAVTDKLLPTDPSSSPEFKSLTVGNTRAMMVVLLLFGLACASIGFVLELIIYKNPGEYGLDPGQKVVPGWIIIMFGAALACGGLYGLIVSPTMLVVDSTGVHSPQLRLSIPWDQILGVRAVKGSNYTVYIAVSVWGLGQIPKADFAHRMGSFAADFELNEVPIALGACKYDLDTIVSTIESHIQPQPINLKNR